MSEKWGQIASGHWGAHDPDALPTREKKFTMSSDELCEHGHPIADCHELQAKLRAANLSTPPADPNPIGRLIRLPVVNTDSAGFILERLVPQFMERFVKKNSDYGDQHRYALGPQAEWVGIDRKIAKLEKALWQGEEPVGESTEEMLYDVIGQCFLILDLLAGNWEPRSRVARKAP